MLHFDKVAKVHYLGEVNIFFMYVLNVLPAYSNAKIIKNQMSFYETQCVQVTTSRELNVM